MGTFATLGLLRFWFWGAEESAVIDKRPEPLLHWDTRCWSAALERSDEVRFLMTSVDLMPDPHRGTSQAPEAVVGCLKHMMLGSGVRADLSAAEFSLLWGAGSIRSPLRWCHVPPS